jgi:type I restriction enzyme S subunit
MNKSAVSGWSEKVIDSLGKTFNGLTGKSGDDFNSGESFLTYLQIFNQKVDQKSMCGKVRIKENEKQHRVNYGDFLFTTSSETPEEVGYSSVFLSKDFEPYLNSFCFGFRPNNFEEIYPPFAKYLFRGQSFRKKMLKLAQGSTRYNISKSEFLKTTLTLPSIDEQIKIAEILQTSELLLDNSIALIDKLKNLKSGVLNDLLKHRKSNSWSLCCIGDLVEKVIDNRGKTPPILKTGHFELLEVASISGDSRYPVYDAVTKYISEETYKSWFRSGHPVKDDILVPTVGSIGSFSLMKESRGAIAQNIVAIRPNKLIDPEFFYYLLNGNQVQSGISSVLMGAVQPSLRVPHFLDLEIYLPPIDEQLRIRNILSSINDRIEIANNFFLKRKYINESLLQNFLSGEIRMKVN